MEITEIQGYTISRKHFFFAEEVTFKELIIHKNYGNLLSHTFASQKFRESRDFTN